MTIDGGTAEGGITVDKELFDELIERSHDFERAQQVAKVGSWHIDLSRKNAELRWSEQTYRIFGIEMGARVNFQIFMDRVHPDDRLLAANSWKNALRGEPYDFEHRIVTPSGTLWVHEIAEVRSENGKCVFAVGTVRDITEAKLHKMALERMAHYDPLTQLPNRALLADRLNQGIALARRQNCLLAVCCLDLDGFKPVNDYCGHESGDLLLQEIASKLSTSVREADTVARIGGDEFVILLVGLTTIDEIDLAASRILAAIRTDFDTPRGLYEISGSMGITVFPDDSSEGDLLVRHADQAMYAAKEAGKNRFQHFDSGRLERTKSRSEGMRLIRNGLESGEFELHYQPKVRLSDRRLTGFEALARWRSKEGMVSPAVFMPAIDEGSFSAEFGEWVIRTALAQMSSWQKDGVDYVSVSVNVSPVHLQNPRFAESLADILRDFPEIDPGCLEIEIVETAAIQNLELTTATLEQCRSMGVRFALDDFGTGYSSLAYLKRIRSDTLKIDQTFVRDMLENVGDLNIVQGVIGLAEAFGHSSVAEGVETEGQAELLRMLGCASMQGYLISRPLPPCGVREWVSEHGQGIAHPPKRREVPFRQIVAHLDLLTAKSRHWEWCHRIWAQFEKGMVPTEECLAHCRVQDWYGGVGAVNYGKEPWFENLGVLIRRLHAKMRRTAKDFSSGNLVEYESSRERFVQAQKQFLRLLDRIFESKTGGKPAF
ncbi:MAG: EAL domain-containing protein [Patescibacteria group bacterium]